MTDLVLDTHALIWYLEKSPRLSDPARGAVKSCVDAGGVLYVPVVSLVEILYLDEKGKLPAGALKKVLAEMQRLDSGLAEAPSWRGWLRPWRGSAGALCPIFPTG
jgi:PIN domain nuclease of toxin-antitoxin system